MASVGSGVTLTLGGSFAARATDNGLPIGTTATGDATGTNAAVGAALAVSFTDQSVTATTGSNITTPGTASLTDGRSGNPGNRAADRHAWRSQPNALAPNAPPLVPATIPRAISGWC